jgi:hypothetical protein
MVEHDEQLRAQLADLYRPAFRFPVLLGSEIYRLAQPWVGQRAAQLADRLSSYDDNLVASTGLDIASVAGGQHCRSDMVGHPARPRLRVHRGSCDRS